MTERSSAWLEHLVWDQDVAGSNPVAPTTFPNPIIPPNNSYYGSRQRLRRTSRVQKKLREGGMGWPTGLEPATTSTTNWGSTIDLRPPFRAGKITMRQNTVKKLCSTFFKLPQDGRDTPEKCGWKQTLQVSDFSGKNFTRKPRCLERRIGKGHAGLGRSGF